MLSFLLTSKLTIATIGLIVALLITYVVFKNTGSRRRYRLEKIAPPSEHKPPVPTPPHHPLERIQNKDLEKQKQQQKEEEKVVGLRIMGFWTNMVINEKMSFIKALLDLENLGMKASSWVTKIKAQEQVEPLQKDDPYYFRKLAKSRSSRKGGINRF